MTSYYYPSPGAVGTTGVSYVLTTDDYDERDNPIQQTWSLPDSTSGPDVPGGEPGGKSYVFGYGYDRAGHRTSVSTPAVQAAGRAAVKQGLEPGRNELRVGPWELGIDTADNHIYHAVYRP